MKISFLLFLLSFCVQLADAQFYEDSILQHRLHYKQEFLTDDRSPLKAQDTSFLRFFAPDKNYCVIAAFQRSADTIPFEMHTHSGKIKISGSMVTYVLRSVKKTIRLRCIRAWIL